MATTFADLEARVRGLESRALRAEEDITAIIGTITETRDDVRWLKRGVQALLDQTESAWTPSPTTRTRADHQDVDQISGSPANLTVPTSTFLRGPAF